MNTPTLLPIHNGLHVDLVTCRAQSIILQVSTNLPSASCPVCGQPSPRIHSHYQRTLADLPWNRVAVLIHLRSRKFYCDNPQCQRRIFTEPVPSLAQRYARRTNPLQEVFYLLGYALGGQAGARLAVRLGLAVSPDALLQRVRQAGASSVPSPDTVRVLGVDDWAYRRGHDYGTVLVDLERHRVIDLLPDRASQSLADWLLKHEGIEIVCRDRAECYGEGARQGAPHATQVVDRWHLLRNVTDTLETVLGSVTREIREAAYAAQPVPDGRHAPTSNQRQKQAAQDRRSTKFTRFQELLERHPAASRQEIAREAGISRATLYRRLSLTVLPERKGMPPRERKIAAYEEYLRERWEQGCHNGSQLLREIKEQGFDGTYAMIRHLLRDWRVPLRASNAGRRRWVPSARAVKWLLLRPPQECRPRERAFIADLLQRAPIVGKAQELALSFSSLLRKEDKQTLDDWLISAKSSGISSMERCARAMTKDKAAITAAVEQPWSNGQTEGQVHRLKLIKRSMYGRAGFDLLRARVLPMQQAA